MGVGGTNAFKYLIALLSFRIDWGTRETNDWNTTLLFLGTWVVEDISLTCASIELFFWGYFDQYLSTLVPFFFLLSHRLHCFEDKEAFKGSFILRWQYLCCSTPLKTLPLLQQDCRSPPLRSKAGWRGHPPWLKNLWWSAHKILFLMVIIRIEAKVFDGGALEQSLEPWGAKYLPWKNLWALGMYFPIQLFS